MSKIKKKMKHILFKIWFWLGSKLWDGIVISSKDYETTDGILFANNDDLANKYCKIKYK